MVTGVVALVLLFISPASARKLAGAHGTGAHIDLGSGFKE